MNLVGGALWLLASMAATAPATPATRPATTQPVAEIGRLQHPDLKESSGVVKSRQHPGIYWTLNDSGNAPVLYAFDASGRSKAALTVRAVNVDWEDLSIDDANRLYIADFGNNLRKRREMRIYRLPEPDPAVPRQLAVEALFTLKYPREPFDCEALWIWKDYGYVVEKRLDLSPAGLFRFKLTPGEQTLERIGQIPSFGPVTGGAISADGRRVALASNLGLRVYEISGDVAKLPEASPVTVPHTSMALEAVCFDGDTLLCTTETREILRVRWQQAEPNPPSPIGK